MPAFLLAIFSRAFCLVGAAGFGPPGDRTPNLRIKRSLTGAGGDAHRWSG